MKKLLIAVSTCALTIVLAGSLTSAASGSLGGISNLYKPGQNIQGKEGCSFCHGPKGPAGQIIINGPGTLPGGTKGTYQVALVGLLPGPVGGFNGAVENSSAAIAGQMTAGVNSKVRPGGQQIGHDPNPGGKAVNGRVWSFDWTAPSAAPGAYTLYITALAATGNGGPDSLDYWYQNQLAIAVQ